MSKMIFESAEWEVERYWETDLALHRILHRYSNKGGGNGILAFVTAESQSLNFTVLRGGPFMGVGCRRLDEFYHWRLAPGNRGVRLVLAQVRTSETESGAIALVSGRSISDSDTNSVDANSPETNSPQIGDDVIAEVTKLMPKVAMIRILHIEKDGGHRDLSARICLPTFS